MNYIDWSFSLGIFILTIIAIFVYLKPGVEPEYDQKNLISLIEEQFIKETFWTVKVTPLFIQQLEDTYVDGSGATQQAKVKVNRSADWDLAIIDPPTTDIMHSSSGLQETFTCTTSLCTSEEFTLIFSPASSIVPDPTDIAMKCEPSSNPSECDASMGSSDDVKGIDQAKLTVLTTADYGQLKQQWNFPTSREFAIFVDNLPVTTSPAPGDQDDVMVKEIKIYKIDANGNRIPTVVNMRVW